MKTADLLSILACPACQGKLTALPSEEKAEGFLCAQCARVYPVRDGIPVMLLEEAVDQASWESGVRSREKRG